MRLKATSSLLSRDDVIIVASISCIYGLGDPGNFKELSIELKKGKKISRQELVTQLVRMQYERNDQAPTSGQFRVRGDVVDILPAYDDFVLRVELFGDEIDGLMELNAITMEQISKPQSI